MTKIILITVFVLVFLCGVVYGDEIKIEDSSSRTTIRGAFLRTATVQPGLNNLMLEIAVHKISDNEKLLREYEGKKSLTVSEQKDFALLKKYAALEEERIKQMTKYGSLTEDEARERRSLTERITYVFSARTGDKTFEIMAEKIDYSSNVEQDRNYAAQTVYFDEKVPFELSPGIMLKMIKMEGNSLTYQLEVPEELRSSIIKK